MSIHTHVTVHNKLLLLLHGAMFTLRALQAIVAAVCIMPSAMPSLSVFWRNGVTRAMYLAPLQGLSRFSAQRSVSPPMLSRIRSNLQGKNKGVGENKRHKDLSGLNGWRRQIHVSANERLSERTVAGGSFLPEK